MAERKRSYVKPLEIKSLQLKDMWCHDYTVCKTDYKKSRFYVPVYTFSEIEDRVLNEDWNLRDVMHDGKYRTFVECNILNIYQRNIKVVDCTNQYTWISALDWQNDKLYRDGSIIELKLHPYFYTDENGLEGIAGQLRYLEIKVDSNLSKITEIVTDVEPEGEPADLRNSNNDAVSIDSVLIQMVKSLGLTPKDAIKILIEEV